MIIPQLFGNQPWWGKIIGAFLGYLVFGPPGALFGVLVGNFFDKGLRQQTNTAYLPYHNEQRESVREIFLKATFSVLGHISKADGRISEQEIRLAERLMKALELNKKKRSEARAFFNEGKSQQFSLTEALSVLKKISLANPNLITLFVDIQYQAAQLDGLTETKLRLLKTILTFFSLAPLNYEDWYHQQNRRYSSNHQSSTRTYTNHDELSNAYKVLSIDKSANQQEVKRAYRRLMSQHHPDKLMAQGIRGEKIKQANHKTQLIRKAYELICKQNGW